jgi:hypothetical protein
MPDDGDEGTALARVRDGLVIFKRNHMYKLRGRTPDQFYFDEITLADASGRTIGTPSAKSLVNIGANIAFYHGKAVWIYSGGVNPPQKISSAIDASLKSITTRFEPSSVALGYYPARNQLWVSVPTSISKNFAADGSGAANETFIYDIDTQQWVGQMAEGFGSFHYVPITHETTLSASQFSALGEEEGPFFLATQPDVGPSDGGRIWRMDTVGGLETSSHVTFSPFYGRSPMSLKRFLYVDLVFDSNATGQEVAVDWWIDGETGDVTTVPSTWDDSPKVGFSLSDTTKSRARVRVNIGEIGQSLTLKIKSEGVAGETPWRCHSMTFGFQEFESISR